MATKSKRSNEDLFRDSTMTFGEHLEELRGCLVKSLYGVILAFILVLIPPLSLAERTVKFIQEPLTAALERFYLKKSEERIAKRLDELKAEGVAAPNYYKVVELMKRDSMVPTFYRVDVRQLVTLLQSHGVAVEVASVVHRFKSLDFRNATVFCQQLYKHRNDEPKEHVAPWIWRKLSSDGEIRKIVASCAAGKTKLTKAQTDKLAAAIEKNILQSGEKFLKENRAFFEARSDVSLWDFSQEAEDRATWLKAILKSEKTFGKNRHEFNRLLLGMAFPNAVAGGSWTGNMIAITLWQRVADDPRVKPKSLNVHEMFFVLIKAAIVLSLVVSSPWVFHQVWSFVAAGLYPHERRYVNVFLPFSLILFLAGVALCFFFVFRFVLDFLFWFNDIMEVDPDMRISEWFGFALFMPLGFGLAFQLPLVMLFLERIGVMTVEGYLSKWRMAILVISIISMMLTPADPYSMVLMAVPLVVLYFLGIFLCRFMPKGRNPFSEVDEPA